MTSRIPIIVASDVCLYRDGVVQYIEGIDCPLSVVGTAGDAGETFRLVETRRPAATLIDMAMPESLATVRRIVEAFPEARVVALALPEVEQDVIACAEAGIAGYVPREGSLEDLVATVAAAIRGELLVSPRMAASLLKRVSRLASHARPTEPGGSLTSRELEIAGLLEDRLGNKQIAAELGIGVATVKNHVHNILEKLQLRSRDEVVPALRRQRACRLPLDLGRRGVAR